MDGIERLRGWKLVLSYTLILAYCLAGWFAIYELARWVLG